MAPFRLAHQWKVNRDGCLRQPRMLYHVPMIRLLITLLLAVPALAQETRSGPPPAVPPPVSSEAPPAPPPAHALVRVQLVTAMGPIVLALEKERAPLTTANFLRYVDQKRLDGTTFYRALKLGGPPQWPTDVGLVQGGVGQDGKKLLPPVAHEPTSETGLKHVHGSISMARLAPGSARGDFFITLGEIPSLDANPEGKGDNQGFAVFGHVEQGMDIIHKTLAAPRSPTLGEGAMRGQMLANPVRIISARHLNN